MALLEEAEAEAAEAEALAAAARARARVARLRREAQEKTEAAEAKSESAEITEVETADQQSLDVEESDEETAEATVEVAAPESRRPRRIRAATRLPSLSATVKVVAIILICAFAGASGYMVWEDHNAAERRQRAANFIAGAKQGVVNMASLDFHRAKEDVQRLLDSSTGQFRDEFQQRAKDFVRVVEESQVVTQGTINAAAVESMAEHSASVLVSATSTITNADGAKDEPRVWRLRVTVTEEGGQYKMSKLEFVP
ncbi:hypothetical protein BST27_02595 [Mycobacterium intermedium]|uniref:Mammalian cell entry protein n=2 Tax=Mycobacterium intermedium TaxID=28445 RepID=A0A1E3SJI2_MYCIE|nr:hypothetical protein [Mycobacterium intermedium]MCV6963881.1 hypothetical protein [Mycobacterium intermedium]ODR02262.1 hypothetical protein BHQ20_05415 [Mycobacterium intermedium]OPE52724.1 hypothetical protein BV508_01565 [Mycobacterium intermedium]ORB10256.1 hypothetical protein BST27_02595 [Mycobacterium intermedium]